MIRKLRYMLISGTAALAAPAAMAEACGTQDIVTARNTFVHMRLLSTRMEGAQQSASQIGELARNCPDTAWIRLIAAGAEINLLERNEAADPKASEAVLAERFGHVERAFEHLEFFRLNKPEDIRVGSVRLAYDEWADVAGIVLQAMLRLAEKGHVHPLVSETPPPLACDYVITSMATTASGYRHVQNPASTRFMESVAEVCRVAEDPMDWNVLFQLAHRKVRLVREGVITDPAAIQHALRSAYADSRQYLRGNTPPWALWMASNEEHLQEMLAKHKPDLSLLGSYDDIPRADWFRPEHPGTEDLTHSIALAISRLWTPLAAGVTDAEREDVAKARSAVFSALIEMGKEADEAGQAVAGRQSIIDGLTAFQKGIVRTPETETLPPFPDWLYNSCVNFMQRKIDEAGQ